MIGGWEMSGEMGEGVDCAMADTAANRWRYRAGLWLANHHYPGLARLVCRAAAKEVLIEELLKTPEGLRRIAAAMQDWPRRGMEELP